MALPEEIAKHKSTIYLIFSPLCKPFAELAIWKVCNHPAHLKIGLDVNLTSTESKLIIPKGEFATHRTELKGKETICRYLCRHNPTLYNEKNIVERSKIDEFISNIPSKLEEYLKPPTNIGHFIAWDYAMNHPGSSKQPSPFKEIEQEIQNYIENAPLIDVFKFKIAEQVAKLTGLEPFVVFRGLAECRDKKVGDITLPCPILKLASPPAVTAKLITEKFSKNDYISEVSQSGIFVYFKYNREKFRRETIKQVLKTGCKYGQSSHGFGNLAIVEFSSPNIAKPFHAGHLRSTIIGNFVNNALKASGYSTYTMNYLGDWGRQYGLLAIGYAKYGSEEKLQQDPIKHLFDVYVEINKDAKEDEQVMEQAREYFKKMEDGDPNAYALWKRFRDLSIVKYKEIYNRLNVSFDEYSGESQYSLGQMREVLDELHAKNILTNDNGALIVDLKEFGFGTAVIGKTDGSMLYLSRDIAAAQDRHRKFDFDEMFYVVASQQDHHFNQLFKILELLGKPWGAKCHHINFGMIEGMSTRKGNVVFLEDMLDQTKEEMHNVMKKNEVKYAQIEDPDHVSDIVGMSSIIIQDMGARRIRDYTFDMNRMLSFEGDTGPYLQYAHARLCSIERQSSLVIDDNSLEKINFDLLSEEKAQALIDMMAIYPDVVKEAAKIKEPITVVKFCLKLSHCVSSAVTDLYVQNQPEEIALARLAMYKAARIALGNGLSLVGLKPLERM